MQKRIKVEEFAAGCQVFSKPLGRHTVHVAHQIQGVGEGKVPPQLGPLSKNNPDPFGNGAARLPWDEAKGRRRPGVRNEDASQHLDGGALARTVRSENRDHLACLDREADASDRLDLGCRAGKQRSKGTEAARSPCRDAK